MATETTAAMVAFGLTEVLFHDALTAFPQPSLNLVTSVALL